MRYLARLTYAHPDILVEFPDCPGCQTFGSTRSEAIANAREALEGWLEAHLVAGDLPPAPRARAEVGEDSTLIEVPPILAVRLELRRARHTLGLSQGALAERIGVTRQQISLLESPDANITLRTLERVVSAMGLRLDIRLLQNDRAADSHAPVPVGAVGDPDGRRGRRG